MKQHRRNGHLAITILCVLIYAFLFSTAVVFADEPPPSVNTEETTAPLLDETPATPADKPDEQVEAPDTDTADPADPPAEQVATIIEEPAPQEDPSDEPASQEPDPASETASDPAPVASEDGPALEQLPADTSVVVVVDAQVEPLATQEAADALALGDPIWCPAGEKPGGAGCTASYTSLATLLKDLRAQNGGTGVDKDGTIWIEDSYDSSVNDFGVGSFVLNGTTLTTWADYSITFQGGWDGKFDNAGNVVSGGVSDFSVPLRIVNWMNTVSVSDISIISNTTGHGLTVTTSGAGDINIHNVTSSKNSNGHGAILSNKSVGSSGNIKVTGSSFNGNNRNGLVASSNGSITLENVTADNNGENGASLNNRDGTGSITLTGASFNGNTLSGLRAISTKDISIASLTAEKNGSYGAFLNNSTGSGIVKLSGTNLFTGNTLDGLRVISAGSISNTGDLTAGDNGQYGIFLRNTAGTAPISLGGTIVVKENTWHGLYAASKADIFISANLTATDNLRHGVFLNNSAGTGKIAFTGTSLFSGNKLDGLRVSSAGNITSSGQMTAKGNRYGLYLDNTAGTGYVKLEGTNTFSDNRRDGLYIKSNGNITVKNATASTNKQNGFNVETSGGTTDLWCGKSENNGAYGVNVTQNKGIILFGMEFTGNKLGDVNVDGGNTLYGSCEGRLNKGPNCDTEETISAQKPGIKVVSVSGAQEQVGLDCQRYAGTKLILPNGDFALIPCPIGDFASLTAVPDATQPLPNGSVFESGFTLEITPSVDGFVTISFLIPKDVLDADLAILFWNGSEWLEVDNIRKKGNGFEAMVERAGIYVLVSR